VKRKTGRRAATDLLAPISVTRSGGPRRATPARKALCMQADHVQPLPRQTR